MVLVVVFLFVGWAQARQAEWEATRAQLSTRALQAEEELKNFQQFMQTEMTRKEQQLYQLRKEVDEWRKRAGG